ncbi:TetR/AcrR family transcriptional regulator [Kitasatospora sp. NPDC057904]|uniref:TetR/AcrR family transcriptional regulator n=1 Tax=unclassified Kitasatospora TaxID=2633591 RepID=UPI0036DA7875
MPRWKPDGFERLQAAAFDLFEEQGFERTTVAEIAQRAGLTQRTFFNHFADKREVLFGLGSEFQVRIVAEITACHASVPPLDAVVRALQVVGEATFEGMRLAVARRHEIVNANPELQERELGKQASLTKAVAAGLQARGVDLDTALLAAGAGILVLETAIRLWTRPGETRPLRDLLAEVLQSLRATVSL